MYFAHKTDESVKRKRVTFVVIKENHGLGWIKQREVSNQPGNHKVS